MKLTKQSLRQMIIKENDRIKLTQKGMSKGKQATAYRDAAKDIQSGAVGGEFTPLERSLVTQISDVITAIASAPEVDLGQYRQQLNTVMTKLKKITGAVFPNEEAPDAKAGAKGEGDATADASLDKDVADIAKV